jgi:hypothetical protein
VPGADAGIGCDQPAVSVSFSFSGSGSLALLPGVVSPSGDGNGVKDVANVAAAVASDGAATLLPGIYYGATAVSYSNGSVVQSLAGKAVTRWNNTGAGPAFLLENAGAYDGNTPAVLRGLRIDGSGSGGAANAFQAGDIENLTITDLWLSNWQAARVAAYFKNTTWWTELAEVELQLQNCSNAVKLDQSGTGTNSFARCKFNLRYNNSQNFDTAQYGIILAGSGTTGVNLYQGALNMYGNWARQSAPVTGAAIAFTTPNAQMLGVKMQVGMEMNGAAAYGIQTVNFGYPSNNIQDGWGNLNFLASPNAWAPSNNNQQFYFKGSVSGDITLAGAAPNYQPPVNAIISSGYPAGWSGSVTFRADNADGLCFVNLALTVASGTLMTNFTTILTGIPTWARPTDNRTVWVIINGQPSSFVITPAGAVIYNGATMTPGANVFPYGQATYLK